MAEDDPTHRPRVSVVMVTFRHAQWVGAAIESVLAQDFDDWEIVVADDQSDDDTVAVARSYEERCIGPHGPRLRVLPVEKKYGRRPNFERVLVATRGDFIAHLDGDDVFLDPTKLRRQVEILDGDPSVVGVFGAWYETDEHLEPVGDAWRGFGLEGRTRFGARDFGPHCVTTSCVAMFRRMPFGELPQWWRDCDVGDWPLHMLNALHGDYVYMDEVLSSHRNHGAGIWSGRNERDQVLSTVRTYELFLANLPEPQNGEVRDAILRGAWGRASNFLRAGEADAAVPLFEFCARHRTEYPPRFKLWRRLRRARRASGR